MNGSLLYLPQLPYFYFCRSEGTFQLLLLRLYGFITLHWLQPLTTFSWPRLFRCIYLVTTLLMNYQEPFFIFSCTHAPLCCFYLAMTAGSYMAKSLFGTYWAGVHFPYSSNGLLLKIMHSSIRDGGWSIQSRFIRQRLSCSLLCFAL